MPRRLTDYLKDAILGFIIIVLWLLGYIALDLGAILHVLLVVALVLLVLRLVQGRRVVCGPG